jgi:hypothetical protein
MPVADSVWQIMEVAVQVADVLEIGFQQGIKAFVVPSMM